MKKLVNYAFIDSQNLHMAVHDQGWKVDYKKFRIYLKDKYKVEKAFIFIGYLPVNESLYTQFQVLGYIVIFKPTFELKGVVKGNCDAELVLHCMIEKSNYDKAVIVSGDGDFHCLIEYLEESDKLQKLITPSFKYSSLVRRFAKYIVPVPVFKKKVELKDSTKKGAFPRHKNLR